MIARAGDVVAVLGGVGDRPALLGDAALVHQVDDQLQLVQALEVGDLGLVAGLGEHLEAVLHQLRHAAAEHGLLAEQVGLGLLGERGLDAAGAQAADALGVGQREVPRLAGRVLLDGDEHRHAAALGVLAADQVARALRRDHRDVDTGRRLDVAEADVEAVPEEERVAVDQVRLDRLGVQLPLDVVGRQDHDQVGLLARPRPASARAGPRPRPWPGSSSPRAGRRGRRPRSRAGTARGRGPGCRSRARPRCGPGSRTGRRRRRRTSQPRWALLRRLLHSVRRIRRGGSRRPAAVAAPA